jgi:hypothetical protein
LKPAMALGLVFKLVRVTTFEMISIGVPTGND